ncbi:pentapeptide repeat-containing protein [Oscillatoria sp. CS-180]|uniref:pentapeptide repeat-containing protein n=1 Tax=Oscillatoria sp. CS-180 TaxID=3021720 RepID=UPI002330C58C|nr:pentapeptide repeat-containing protein [Oscillatoria sp. CS-180]MDB9526814.1 pentapeptide repeat-containing protein [Oscillatoria sp. CS-180]
MPSKYAHQRLSTKDVLRLYAAGERDFSGAILRGCNFRGEDLSGANFSGADIRGTLFTKANLIETNFSKVHAGIETKWFFLQAFLLLAGSIIISYVSIVASTFLLTEFLNYTKINSWSNIIPVVTLLFFNLLICMHLVIKGATMHTAGIILISYTATVAVSIVYLNMLNEQISSSYTISALSAFTGIGTITVSFLYVAAVPFTALFLTNRSLALLPLAITPTMVFSTAGIGIITVIFSILYLLSTIAIGWRSQNIYTFISAPLGFNLPLAIAIKSILGGTSFRQANLSRAKFVEARLSGADFAGSRKSERANLTHVRWHKAKGLHLSAFSNYLQVRHPRFFRLITELDGTEQDFSFFDLENLNIAGAKFHKAVLKGASLSNSILKNAEFHSANLTEAQCVGTDLTAAQLTGACLEAWNIDDTTILKDIDCQYVFLKEKENTLGVRERLPHNPDKCFEPGDFEKYFREVIDEVKLLIKGGVDPQAFRAAFRELMQQHQITPESVRGIQRKRADVLVSVAAPPDQPKPEIARTFDTAYEKALPASTAQALLASEQRHNQDLMSIIRSLKPSEQSAPNLTIHTNAMTNSNNPSISTGDGSFYAGRDANITSSTVNLGKISGQVSNQISQIPESAPNSEQPDLRELLTQLQAAAEADTELSDDEKAEALGEVAKLAKAGTNPQENAMQRMAKRATVTLKSITEPLTEASKLATTCKTLLPIILTLF